MPQLVIIWTSVRDGRRAREKKDVLATGYQDEQTRMADTTSFTDRCKKILINTSGGSWLLLASPRGEIDVRVFNNSLGVAGWAEGVSMRGRLLATRERCRNKSVCRGSPHALVLFVLTSTSRFMCFLLLLCVRSIHSRGGKQKKLVVVVGLVPVASFFFASPTTDFPFKQNFALWVRFRESHVCRDAGVTKP